MSEAALMGAAAAGATFLVLIGVVTGYAITRATQEADQEGDDDDW